MTPSARLATLDIALADRFAASDRQSAAALYRQILLHAVSRFGDDLRLELSRRPSVAPMLEGRLPLTGGLSDERDKADDAYFEADDGRSCGRGRFTIQTGPGLCLGGSGPEGAGCVRPSPKPPMKF